MSVDALKGQYINLTTFRRDGTPVPTTVWFAHLGDGIVVPTGSTTGKAKRLRNDPTVEMVTAGMRGKVKSDTVVTGQARLLDGDDAQAAEAALRAKYGWQWRFFSSNIDVFVGVTPTS